MPLLELRGLAVRFGGLTAVGGLDLAVEAGSLVALIGPNGAGKTTAFNAITGVYAPSAGHVRFEGHEIGGARPHAIARLGIARTFQNIRLFRGLTALENVVAALAGAERSGFRDVLRGRAWRERERRLRERAGALLERLGLERPAGAPPRAACASAPARCSSASASNASRARAPTPSPTASSGGSRSRAPSPRPRSSSSSTSPPQG